MIYTNIYKLDKLKLFKYSLKCILYSNLYLPTAVQPITHILLLL